MTGKLRDLTFGRNGEQIITLTVEADFREEFERLKDCDISIDIRKHYKHRSNDANAYCWTLCNKIAQHMSEDGTIYTKDDIYRNAIREVGIYKDYPDLDLDRAETLQRAWEMLGTGWVTEQVDYSQDGEKVTIRCYYGSSRYNARQMSRLIDCLIQDCQQLGISTDTPEQIAQIKSLWANAPTEKE